jgi:hypothetical protein
VPPKLERIPIQIGRLGIVEKIGGLGAGAVCDLMISPGYAGAKLYRDPF